MRSFLTGVVAGYGIAIPVGAIAVLIIETGIRRGFRVALAAGAGAATADLVYAAAAVLGGTAVAEVVGAVGAPLRYASAGVLAMIAILGLFRSRGSEAPRPRRARNAVGTYTAFLGLTLVNPATVVYFAAVVVGLGIATRMTAGQGVAFVAGAGLASLSWQTLLAWSGAAAGVRLGESSRRLLSITGYLVILGLGVAILFG